MQKGVVSRLFCCGEMQGAHASALLAVHSCARSLEAAVELAHAGPAARGRCEVLRSGAGTDYVPRVL